MVKVKKSVKKTKTSEKKEASCNCPRCRGEEDGNVIALIELGEFATKLALMAYSDGLVEKGPIAQLKKSPKYSGVRV